jgi:hypothetical protein
LLVVLYRYQENDRLLVRYRELVDKRHLTGLSEPELRELELVGKQIDEQNESFYAPIILRIRQRLSRPTT